MNINESIEYLDSITRIGSKLGLDSIETLLKKLGNPEKELKVIHVAGTNGKGSTCTTINNILIESGYKVGLYTSPYINNYYEIIQINNKIIEENLFYNYVNLVREQCNKLVEQGYAHPTIFEFITAIAFKYFKDNNIDCLVLEVGLGGREDATNVIDKPLVSVITSIGYDHTEYLGNTLESIAYNKGGIIKRNCPVVLAPNNDEVVSIIKNICNELDCKLFYNKEEEIKISIFEDTIHNTIFSVDTQYYTYDLLVTHMKGKHQIFNISTSLLVVCILKNIYNINNGAIYKGILKSYIPCRLEYITDTTIPFLLDGGHNCEGVITFINAIKQYIDNKNIVLIFGALKDKPYIEMLNALLPYVKECIITEPINNRALKCDEWEKVIINKNNIKIISDYKESVQYAISKADKNSVICCVGSLYLVYLIRDYIREYNG